SIPNREVKPACADGTADCGRVGGRHLKGSFFEWSLFYFFDVGYIFTPSTSKSFSLFPFS
ncbi:MAG: hypothetical protein U0L67_05615, partial [Paludibacteraceae bacterium]|nr:hypothetical protein [Paludibacteraceae bacterium]